MKRHHIAPWAAAIGLAWGAGAAGAANPLSGAELPLGVNQAVAIPGADAALRVLESGDNGDVDQSNSNRSGDAYATNGNETAQANTQRQTGTGGDARSGDATGDNGGEGGNGGDADSGAAYGGDVDQSQTASNSNRTSQEANARSEAVQIAPRNTNISVRILSDGDDGDVTQSNSNQSGDAFAGNWNGTEQSNVQSQSGTGGDASSGDATGGAGGSDTSSKSGGKDDCGCRGDGGDGGDADSGDAYGGDVDQRQNASNSNNTSQSASAYSKAWQAYALNEVRGNEQKGVMAR